LTIIFKPLSLALGGKTGARLGAMRHVPTSPDTLLRLIRQLPDPPMVTPTILGVDDGATRRGRTYGTLLVNLECHRPIDLWPDRTADMLDTWLRAHPGVTILSRDRSTKYTRGATQGAPDAQHILHRWLLVRHLREALELLRDWRHHRWAMLTTSQAATAPTLSVEARSFSRALSGSERFTHSMSRSDKLPGSSS
jgi:transposase